MLPHLFGQFVHSAPPADFKGDTLLIAAECDEKGFPVPVLKCVETSENPNLLLSFDDCRLQSLLDAGIKPQHLAIRPDMRIGSDAQVSEYMLRLNSLVESSQVEPKN